VEMVVRVLMRPAHVGDFSPLSTVPSPRSVATRYGRIEILHVEDECSGKLSEVNGNCRLFAGAGELFPWVPPCGRLPHEEGRPMTESEWLTATDPTPMLAFLAGNASDRKLRLFAAACCRQVWHLLTDERSRKAVKVAERYADGLADEDELFTAWEA